MKTVLLTDDNAEMIELVKLILEGSGFKLITAHDGNEAIVICMEQQPDLVLMDLNMPNINGFKAIEYLRSEGFNKPIIVLTGSESDEDRQMANDAGCDGYIVKTMEMQGVKQIIDHHLQGHGGID